MRLATLSTPTYSTPRMAGLQAQASTANMAQAQKAEAFTPSGRLQRQGLKVSPVQAKALLRRIEAQLNVLENPSSFQRFARNFYRKSFGDANRQNPSIVERAIKKLAQKLMPESPVPMNIRGSVIAEWRKALVYLKNHDSRSTNTLIRLRYLDLSRLRLNGADFSHLTLTHCKFNKSALIGATFQGAVLTGTSFKGASLEGANFAFADFDHTFFDRAKIIPYNPNFIGILKNNVQRRYFPTVFWVASGLDKAPGLPKDIDTSFESLKAWWRKRGFPPLDKRW
jgi:hypothetical protein